MTKRMAVAIVGVVALVLVVAGVAHATAPHQYQFTGTVTVVEGTNVTVQKSAKETWIFSTEGSSGVSVKKGDAVTVYYHMVADKIETKGGRK